MSAAGREVSSSTGERIVVGYFSDGADAYRAINELVDEGFLASEVGAAFRTPRATDSRTVVQDTTDPISLRNLTETNPAMRGSVGGAGSHDEAVTPAGLAPGSGNAFPGAPTSPGPIPGSEIPSTLRHDLPEMLPHDLPSASAVRGTRDAWLGRLDERYGSTAAERKSSQKFGTGEGRLNLVPEHGYSAPAFETSFQGMGLSVDEARRLSGDLGRGGAVVSVRAGAQVALAEGILERNHGRVRIENPGTSAREADRESPVEVYGSMCAWYPGEQARRRAS